MKYEEFSQLVEELEKQFSQDPSALKRRIFRFVLLGYAALLGIMVGFILLAAVLLGLALWFQAWVLGVLGLMVLVAGGWMLAHSSWTKVPKPIGHKVTARTAPQLFQILQELQSRMNSRRFSEVLISPDLSAAVHYRPRLASLLGHRTYLVIGWPVLENFSAMEVKSIIAHEMAHLTRGHGKFGHWIYGVRLSWENLIGEMQKNNTNTPRVIQKVVLGFMNWFWPRFNGHAFLLSRLQEYEADSLAGQTVGHFHLASSLYRLRLQSQLLSHHFWPPFWQLANDLPKPPLDLYRRMNDSIRHCATEVELARWRDQAFKERTGTQDTHPCLTERLRNLNQTIAAHYSQVHEGPPAAEEWFGSDRHKIEAIIQSLWCERFDSDWKLRHERAASINHRLQQLQLPSHAAAETDIDRKMDQAKHLIDLKDDAAAEPLLREVLGIKPHHREASFYLGRHLLRLDQEQGEALLEWAAQEASLTGHALECLHDYHRRHGHQDKLKHILKRWDEHRESVQSEFKTVDDTDEVIPPQLSPELTATLTQFLQSQEYIKQAYLAQRKTAFPSKTPLFLLYVQLKGNWLGVVSYEKEQDSIQRLQSGIKLPGRLYIFTPKTGWRRLAGKLSAYPLLHNRPTS